MFVSALQHTALLNGLILGVMAERYRSLGKDESGLYGFYYERLRHSEALISYDYGLAQWILEHRPDTDIVVDVGSGIGQFSALLAANGIKSIACEIDARRFAALQSVIHAVRCINEQWADRIEASASEFPHPFASIAGKTSLGVFACFVGTMTLEFERSAVRGLRMFDEAIIDIKRFGRMTRDTPEHVQEFLTILKEEGLSEPEPVLNWGNGQYGIVRPV